MDVAKWLEPHQEKLPTLTLPKHFVSLKEIWPEVLWDDSDDEETAADPVPVSGRKRQREGHIDSVSLWTKTEESSDKLFFISHIASNTLIAKWYLASVLPTTDPTQAKQNGIYSVGWWIPQERDSDKADKDKKFVPEVHVFHPTSGFGQVLTNFRIGQLETQLMREDRERYALDINLWTDGILGPFNWSERSRYGHKLSQEVWTSLASRWSQVSDQSKL